MRVSWARAIRAQWPLHPARSSRSCLPLDHAAYPAKAILSTSKAPTWTQKRSRASIGSDVHIEHTGRSLPPQTSKDGHTRDLAKSQFEHNRSLEEVNRSAGSTVCPRNAVGVQLLSGSLEAQLFPSTSVQVPGIHPDALNLSQHHLKAHGLEPEQASSLPPIAFDLPPLQGKDLSQHFWNLGKQAAQPWLGMAHNLAKVSLIESMPEGVTQKQEKMSANMQQSQDDGAFNASDWLSLDPSIRSECNLQPPKWLKAPGWVRYPVLHSPDGARALGPGEPVDYPLEEDGAMVFDVETMVQEGNYPVMATAASANAWYAWLSPWFLQKGHRHQEKDHLIPFGPRTGEKPKAARLLIGHNVSYDRARIRDEYSLERSNIRFLDTMSLHVATRGISSPQRGAWMKYNKSKTLQKMLEQDDVEDVKKAVIMSILDGAEVDEDILASLDLDEIVAQAQGKPVNPSIPIDVDSSGGAASASLLWQDITSNNGLADVAKLHCNIELPKDVRNFFVDGTSREELVEMTDELLTYCATDALVTHKVFTKVWPSFVKNCPNPATAAGVLALSSAILPVDDEWTEYIKRCDEHYESSLQQVRENLIELAERLRIQGTDGVSWARAMIASEAHARELSDGATDNLIEMQEIRDRELQREKLWWESDPWACQLDWTPKKPKKNRAGQSAVDETGEPINPTVPKWYRDKVLKAAAGLGPTMALNTAILRLRYEDKPFLKSDDGHWVASGKEGKVLASVKGSPLKQTYLKKGPGVEVTSALGKAGDAVLEAIRTSAGDDAIRGCLREAADAICAWAIENPQELRNDTQLQMLDWTQVDVPVEEEVALSEEGDPLVWWPKWYWDLYKSATGELEVTIRSKVSPLLLRLTWQGCPLHHSREYGWVFRYDPKSQTPLLTRQKVLEFKNPADVSFRNDVERTVLQRLADIALSTTDRFDANIDPASITPVYYKVPHAAGDDSNVGSPFSKNFVPFFEKGTLQSEHPEEKGREAAKSALEINARCSYWIGVRDRVQKQMVVWDGEGETKMNFERGASGARQDEEAERLRRKGLILPQIVPMGTVTRRAIEKTWLTASNAKTNRVGSELKAMVKAPPGWSIVGADVDSQELWICSVMGDAQFGFHGATAVGWMTLEGSKNMGTDLHSKTAKILGTSRNQAKVFNYSRIYGAGIRHSSQLLLKASPDMSTEEAMRKAKELYASTKGKNTYTNEYFGRRFWFGGTESYVFNKLEEIALGEQPKTPALDCGVTAALTRKYLPQQTHQRQRFGRQGMATGGEDYMPSRINWVVQSSGVDYLHLLVTAMEHLITTYDLQARFMISVHDEVRYLAKDEDVDRVTMALQIANLWTRAMFAYKLQMQSLPQGVGFFAQVDVDKVLRKETDDPCLTPSQPRAIPFGRAADVYESLEKTNGGSLFADGRRMTNAKALAVSKTSASHNAAALVPPGEYVDTSLPRYKLSAQKHRSLGDRGLRFLQAQASGDVSEISALEERVQRQEQREGSKEIFDASEIGSDETFLYDVGHEEIGRRSSDVASHSGHGLQKRPRKEASRSVSGNVTMRSASLHTSARLCSRLPATMQAIVDQFPPRPFKLHVPFFKTTEHRFKMLWQVYARLLRACPREHENIREKVRYEMRKRRHLASPRQCAEHERRAQEYIALFVKAKEGDEGAREELNELDERIGDGRHKAKWRRLAEEYEESQKFKPQPRLSGALLPPSLFNPPLLRYKPVQPDHITMMIARRKKARQERQERMADVEERIRQVALEAQFGQSVGAETLNERDGRDWAGTLLVHERRLYRESNARDHERTKLTYSIPMLRMAKNARRGRKRLAIRRKRERTEAVEGEKRKDVLTGA